MGLGWRLVSRVDRWMGGEEGGSGGSDINTKQNVVLVAVFL